MCFTTCGFIWLSISGVYLCGSENKTMEFIKTANVVLAVKQISYIFEGNDQYGLKKGFAVLVLRT